jgi:hypothetical protein
MRQTLTNTPATVLVTTPSLDDTGAGSVTRFTTVEPGELGIVTSTWEVADDSDINVALSAIFAGLFAFGGATLCEQSVAPYGELVEADV